MAELRGRLLRLGAAALALGATACAPSLLPPPSEPSPTATAPVQASLPQTPRPTAIDTSSIELHLLGAAYTPGGNTVSAAGQILWTGGRGRWLGEIWRFVPGSPTPERIYVSKAPQSIISSVLASASGYAFVEQSEPAFGKGGWRVWYLSGPGAEPVQLDQGVAKEAGFPPTIAMDEERVVWAGFDEPATGFVTRIGIADIADVEHPRTLLERPVDRSLIWYPALDGDELWYGTIDPASDPAAEGPEYTLEMLDLASPLATPVPFAGTGHDFNPAVNDEFLVWKANRRGDAALNWGTLKILDRRSQVLRTIPGDDANRPSIGDRFVSFDGITHATLPVYDPASRTLVNLACDCILGVPSLYGAESISGRLLTFFVQPSEVLAPPRIGWAILPE
jgi:hypothetical protein